MRYRTVRYFKPEDNLYIILNIKVSNNSKDLD